MRILIVDDEYTSRAKLKALLAPYGDCDAAPAGGIAFSMFKTAHEEGFPYGLITMDVQLPDGLGQEIVKRMRDWEQEKKSFCADAEARIVMVSFSYYADDVMMAYRTGCDDYLSKPVSADRLQEILAKLGIERAPE